MDQLHVFDCHQNVAESLATKYTHVYTGSMSQTWL